MHFSVKPMRRPAAPAALARDGADWYPAPPAPPGRHRRSLASFSRPAGIPAGPKCLPHLAPSRAQAPAMEEDGMQVAGRGCSLTETTPGMHTKSAVAVHCSALSSSFRLNRPLSGASIRITMSCGRCVPREVPMKTMRSVLVAIRGGVCAGQASRLISPPRRRPARRLWRSAASRPRAASGSRRAWCLRSCRLYCRSRPD